MRVVVYRVTHMAEVEVDSEDPMFARQASLHLGKKGELQWRVPDCEMVALESHGIIHVCDDENKVN